jgi:NitT/TauT family transport system ATP-binding protein
MLNLVKVPSDLSQAAAIAEPARQIRSDRGHILIDRVSISFEKRGSHTLAVTETSIEIRPGEFVAILGPSGCGKSTLLNSVAGYIPPSTGEIKVDGKPVSGPGPDRGMVFQQYSLFPWKTVRENVAFGPRMLGRSNPQAVADTFIEMVGLSKFSRRYPKELSGGMQQRVGIARALANYPDVLLMDEPFGALDSQTRRMMQESLLQIWSEFGTTVVFVTHDIDEAVFLGDRVLIMSASPGQIIADIAVDLPRPRDPDLAVDERFMHLRRRCHEYIRAESLKAFEQQNR